MATLCQKTPTSQCAVCHRSFMPGDRVLPVYIVQQVGRNMETKDIGAWLGGDFELMHAACADPGLEGRIIGMKG